MLCSAPGLAYPDLEVVKLLDMDASNGGDRAVHSQTGVYRKDFVLGYASQALNYLERNYCVTRQELLAIIFRVHKFCVHLAGPKLMVHTYHSTL